MLLKYQPYTMSLLNAPATSDAEVSSLEEVGNGGIWSHVSQFIQLRLTVGIDPQPHTKSAVNQGHKKA